jgi:TrmH family RNA methyltransferase
MQWLTSAQNPTFKIWVKLAQKRKVRKQMQHTLLEGLHLIESALQANFPLQHLMIAETALLSVDIQNLLKACQVPTTCLTDKLFSQLSELATPTGVIALIKLPARCTLKHTGLIVALEGIQDPGNVGNILRTAIAAGVQQVWLDKQCVDIWSPKVLRAGMGAHFTLSCIEQVDLLPALALFKGPSYATLLDKESQSLYKTRLPTDMVLIMGNEGMGISPLMQSQVDVKIKIPMQKGIESLNVSAATAVCLYEHYRQQQQRS